MRKATLKRNTRETSITLKLNLDGEGRAKIITPIGFLNHMLELLSFHANFDLEIKGSGDLEVDLHHLNEDIGIVLGKALDKTLGRRKGIVRFSSNTVPMDLSLVRVSLDISGRPCLDFQKGPAGKFFVKDFKGYNLNYARQFLLGIVHQAKITLHIDILKADDPHHVLEAIFKGLALCLFEATRIRKRKSSISTKDRK